MKIDGAPTWQWGHRPSALDLSVFLTAFLVFLRKHRWAPQSLCRQPAVSGAYPERAVQPGLWMPADFFFGLLLPEKGMAA